MGYYRFIFSLCLLPILSLSGLAKDLPSFPKSQVLLQKRITSKSLSNDPLKKGFWQVEHTEDHLLLSKRNEIRREYMEPCAMFFWPGPPGRIFTKKMVDTIEAARLPELKGTPMQYGILHRGDINACRRLLGLNPLLFHCTGGTVETQGPDKTLRDGAQSTVSPNPLGTLEAAMVTNAGPIVGLFRKENATAPSNATKTSSTILGTKSHIVKADTPSAHKTPRSKQLYTEGLVREIPLSANEMLTVIEEAELSQIPITVSEFCMPEDIRQGPPGCGDSPDGVPLAPPGGMSRAEILGGDGTWGLGMSSDGGFPGSPIGPSSTMGNRNAQAASGGIPDDADEPDAQEAEDLNMVIDQVLRMIRGVTAWLAGVTGTSTSQVDAALASATQAARNALIRHCGGCRSVTYFDPETGETTIVFGESRITNRASVIEEILHAALNELGIPFGDHDEALNDLIGVDYYQGDQHHRIIGDILNSECGGTVNSTAGRRCTGNNRQPFCPVADAGTCGGEYTIFFPLPSTDPLATNLPSGTPGNPSPVDCFGDADCRAWRGFGWMPGTPVSTIRPRGGRGPLVNPIDATASGQRGFGFNPCTGLPLEVPWTYYTDVCIQRGISCHTKTGIKGLIRSSKIR